MPGLSQTSIIFGAALIAFIVFITVRGELAQYLQTMFGPAPAAAT